MAINNKTIVAILSKHIENGKAYTIQDIFAIIKDNYELTESDYKPKSVNNKYRIAWEANVRDYISSLNKSNRILLNYKTHRYYFNEDSFVADEKEAKKRSDNRIDRSDIVKVLNEKISKNKWIAYSEITKLVEDNLKLTDEDWAVYDYSNGREDWPNWKTRISSILHEYKIAELVKHNEKEHEYLFL